MASDLTLADLTDVASELGLPHPALVEKDYHVVRALAALREFTGEEPRLFFGGGTALSRAHELIQRMSEDIDLKIVSVTPLTAGERRRFRERVTAKLQDAGFAFDPADPEQLAVHNGGKVFFYQIPYAPVAPAVNSLRPHIRVEFSCFPPYGDPVYCPIKSFVAKAYGRDAEIDAFPCAPVQETAAEKFVALTRRIALERKVGEERDQTLIRHVYDLNRIKAAHSLDDTAKLIRLIINAEKGRGGFEEYAADPLGVSMSSLRALREDPAYSATFGQFQRDMVYGPHSDYEECLHTLEEIAGAVRK